MGEHNLRTGGNLGFRFRPWEPTHSASDHRYPPAPISGVLHDLKATKPHDFGGGGSAGARRKMGLPVAMLQRGSNSSEQEVATLITDGGWVRPSQAGWALPPEKSLDQAVNGGTYTAGGYFTRTPAAARNKPKEAVMETIDSNEAARKYGGRFIF
ncbi:hypothetical protein AXF42_Ash004018 [Apostasia shenzhenica]|uniref:Uncharacterized protein n=1 Tax=Apostasia shenzhenica TaxID=1088818 RepID=A0A2I0AIJ7_9ASPA|nr:hypothetical protein AXF42_Ash004018 [Apostasia shenzhenica]